MIRTMIANSASSCDPLSAILRSRERAGLLLAKVLALKVVVVLAAAAAPLFGSNLCNCLYHLLNIPS